MHLFIFWLIRVINLFPCSRIVFLLLYTEIFPPLCVVLLIFAVLFFPTFPYHCYFVLFFSHPLLIVLEHFPFPFDFFPLLLSFFSFSFSILILILISHLCFAFLYVMSLMSVIITIRWDICILHRLPNPYSIILIFYANPHMYWPGFSQGNLHFTFAILDLFQVIEGVCQYNTLPILSTRGINKRFLKKC